MDDEEAHPIEVTIKFCLPEHEHDLKYHLKGIEYLCALHEVQRVCRRVCNYEDNPSKDRVNLAEEINELVYGLAEDLI